LLDLMGLGSKIPEPEKNPNPSGYRTRESVERADDWKTY
jgi:hypothetical protein